MSILGFDSTGTATVNGLNNIYCNTLYSDDTYINNSTTPINVGTTLTYLQSEIDAINTSLVNIGQGYYGVFASTNNASNVLTQKQFYFSQTIASNGFAITGGTGTSATRITATYPGLYTIYYKGNYNKSGTTSFVIRTWLIKNGTNVDYSTTMNSVDTTTTNNWFQLNNSFTISLAANDYLEIAWYATSATPSGTDLLDYVAATSPYPQCTSMFATIVQVSNTTSGRSDTIAVGSTTTLAAGSSATVTDTTTVYPTYTLHTLAFGIPAGVAGAQGPTGAQGPQGPQGPKGDQGDTNATAIAALTLATTTAAGLTAYIVSNNASQAAQDVLIAGLETNIIDHDARIVLLEVKTTDQSWGSLTGTTFSRNVNITNTGASPGAYAVYLPSSAAAQFLYGLSASNAISTTSTLTSSAGTSQMSSLLVNNNFEVTNDATITAGEMYITRTTLASQKKLVLYDNNVGDDYDYLGLWTNSSNAFNFEGMSGGTYNWYFGNGLGTARSLAKTLSLSADTNYQATSTFLKSVGATQQIQLIRDTPNNKVRIDLMADTAGVNQYDGQIIQEKGNSLDDNKGTMTIQSGGLILNSLNAGIQATSTTSTLIQSSTTTTLTSTGETEINSAAFDLNATGAVTIDTTSTSAITSTGAMTLTTSGTLQTNSVALDINATGAVTLDTTSTSAITSTGAMTLTTSGTLQTNSVALDINATGNVTLDTTSTSAFTSTGAMTLTTSGTLQTNSVALDINATGAVTIDTTSTSAITSTGAMTLTTSGTLQTNSGAFDLNATGNITMDTTGSMAFTNGTGTTLTSPSLALTRSGGGTFNISSVNPVSIITTTIGDDITVQTAGQLNLTSSLSGASDSINITTNTSSGYDLVLNNTTQTAFKISCRDNLTISTPPTRSIDINSGSGGMLLTTQGTGYMSLSSPSGIGLTSSANDVTITSTDATINTTSGIIGLYSAGGIDGGATTGNIQFTASAGDITLDAFSVMTIDGATTNITAGSTINTTSTSDTNITSTTGDINLTATNGVINENANISIYLNAPDIIVPETSTHTFLPTGMIIMKITSTAPDGYLYCDGGAISRTTYARLFTEIGTTYGAGNGTTTFNKPDFRACFIRGASSQTVSGTTYSAAAVGTIQQDAVLAPNNQGYWSVDNGGGGTSRQVRARVKIGGDPNDTGTNQTTNFARESTTENRPLNHALYYFIKY